MSKSADVDWDSGFRIRNKNMSLWKPENTSAGRSFSFNKTAVYEFYGNLEDLLKRYNFTAGRIVNFNETGIVPKVLAKKIQQQVRQIVSAKRGELVTFGSITATGNTIPPIFVFPRVHYKKASSLFYDADNHNSIR